MKNLIDLQKSEIQASQDAYILKQMTVQMKEDAEGELMDQYGLVIADINLLVDEDSQQPFPENLQRVVIQLKQPAEETDAVEAVKSVEINTEEPLIQKTKTESNDKVVQLLSHKWNVDEEVIALEIEGGDKAAQ
jgi:stage III sporulation protein AF